LLRFASTVQVKNSAGEFGEYLVLFGQIWY